MKLKNIFALTAASAMVLTGCEDLDTVPQGSTLTTQQKEEISAAKPERAEASVRAIFAQFNVYEPNYDAIGSRHNDFGYSSIMYFLDSNGEDIVSANTGYNWAGDELDFSDRPYTSNEAQIIWNDFYQIIFNANNVISTIPADTTEPLSQYYLAQGLAARAFCYSQLAQLYQFNYKGHENAPCVPIITHENSADAALNGAPRSTVQEVYDLVLNDINTAIDLLTSAQSAGQKRADKRYIDLAVAYGIRARVYMAMQNYQAALADADAAIANTSAKPASIADVSQPTFCSADENNWMWGIYVAETDDVVSSGIVNWISHNGTFNYGYGQYAGGRQISKKLYNTIPDTDIRKGWWSDANGKCANLTPEWQAYLDGYKFAPYTNCKFAPYQHVLENDVNANDIPLMRVEEMYLIKAEAEFMTSGSKATLEQFVKTYRDPEYVCTAADVQNEVYRQKRIELWNEGLVWFDMMRLNKGIDRRGAGFEPTTCLNIPAGDPILLWRLPQSEIQGNPALNDEDNNPATPLPEPVADADIQL